MNPGILTPPTQYATMPRGLLGGPTPVPMPHGMTWIHPEALDWRARVVANGGRVSSATLAAVSDFCSAIDAAGIRDRLSRLNLFCGTSDASLNAVRTPLYRSGSLGGTPIGNAMDTNVNFAEADYQETGSSGGLKGNGTTKYLNTGLNQSAIPSLTSVHLSYSGTSLETSGDRMALGAFLVSGPVGPWIVVADVFAAYVNGRTARLGSYASQEVASIASPGASESHFIGTRTSATLSTLYRGGSSAANNTAFVSPLAVSQPLFVFAGNSNGTPSSYTAARLRMYSIGNGLTAAQALAFSNAVIAFNTALGRA